MKIQIPCRAALFTAALTLLALPHARCADEAIPSDRRLPKDVVGYISVKNVAELKSRWSKTLFGQMLADESLADFREGVVKHIEEASQQLRDQMGLDLSEILAIPQGEVTMAAVVLPGGNVGGVLLLDFGDQAEAVHKLVEKAAEGIEKNDEWEITRNEEEIEDTRVIVYRTKPGDANEKPRDAGGYFIKATTLVIGSDPALLKEVLTRWDGKHDQTFSENDHYQYVVEKCHDEGASARPQLTWFVDPMSLFQAIAQSHPELVGHAAQASTFLPILGFDKFKGVGGTVDLGQGEFDQVSRTLIMLERSPQGIGNLFQFDLSAQAPPKWISADWTSFLAINWNAAKAYSTVEGFTDMFLGPGALAAQVQKVADDPNFGNLHAKKDIVDQLAGTYMVADLEAEPGTNSASGTLLAVQIKKAASVRATLAKIAGLGLIKFNEREFQGETLYEFESLNPAEDEDDDGKPQKLGIAVAEGHLLFATDVRLLERVLRGAGDTEALADSGAYKRIARRFPSKTASISFSRQDSQLKSLFEMLKTAPEGILGGLEDLDFSKLPDADLLKKYLPPTGSYMEHDPKGLKITTFSLRNESE